MLNKIIKTVALATSALTILLISTNSFADEEAIARGEVVFNTVAGIGCKTCHGEYAEGDLGVGPYIRGASEGAIRAAIGGIDEMIPVKLTITEEQINDISAYILNLGSTKVVRTLAKRGRFLPSTVDVPPGLNIQLVVNNASFKPKMFNSDEIDFQEGITIPARTTNAISWQSPESGESKIYCIDCDLKGEFFTVRVDPDAPRPQAFIPTTDVGKEAVGM